MNTLQQFWEGFLSLFPSIKEFQTEAILNDILRDKDTDEAIILFERVQELFKIEMERRYNESEKEMKAIAEFYCSHELKAI